MTQNQSIIREFSKIGKVFVADYGKVFKYRCNLRQSYTIHPSNQKK